MDTKNANKNAAPVERLASLDALRGFDMFFLCGGAALIAGIGVALGSPKGFLVTQMRHVPWEGLAQRDTIMPLFLFMMGVSWPFSLASQLAKGRTTPRILVKILVRTIALFLVGLSFYGILQFKPHFRVMGVLQFLALSWGLAATLYVFVRNRFALVALAATFLLAHFALLHFCIAPDAPAGAWSYANEWNIIGYWDRSLWPNYMLKGWKSEPQSLFYVPSGAALAMLGIFAGTFLRERAGRPAWRAPAALAASAVVCGLTGWAFAGLLGDPIVKNLSTTSFNLVTAAYSFAMLCLFHLVIDVAGFRRWAIVFDPIGKNSILAYIIGMIGVRHLLWKYYLSGLCRECGVWGEAVGGLGTYMIIWAILFWLKRKNAFLKI